MYALYYYPGNANLAPHMLLRHIGAAYELRLVDRQNDAHRRDDYLALNPNGRIPVLVDGDLVLYETAAICLHLIDKHRDAGLSPPLGSPERAMLYRWLFWIADMIQPQIHYFYYTNRYTEDPSAAPGMKAAADAILAERFEIADREFADGRRFTLGEQIGAPDYYLAMVCRWARVTSHKPQEMRHLGGFLDRMRRQPAVIAAFEEEGLAPPYF